MSHASADEQREDAQVTRVLGIDPGLNRTGYALIERTPTGFVLREGGLVRSTSDRTLAERVGEIGTGILECLRDLRPQAVAIEQVFSKPKHPKTAILMSHARGAILFAAAQEQIPVVHYPATRIKQMLTGSGRAAKEQMQHAVRTELKLANVLEPHDVADAAAVAICHLYASRQLPTTMQVKP